jgi:hypothetical protein
MIQAEKSCNTQRKSILASFHISLIQDTIWREDRERHALNEKPESRNLFICNEVCLSSIRESDEREQGSMKIPDSGKSFHP